eukprot:4937779-Alexandrium_andersonii.AAC.1
MSPTLSLLSPLLVPRQAAAVGRCRQYAVSLIAVSEHLQYAWPVASPVSACGDHSRRGSGGLWPSTAEAPSGAMG